VLRRAQLPSDVLPTISQIGQQLSIDLGSYYPQATRELAPGVYLVIGNAAAVAPCQASNARIEQPLLATQTQTNAEALTYCVTTPTAELNSDNCEPVSNLTSEDDLAIQLAQGGTTTELVPDTVASASVVYEGGRTQSVTATNNLIQFAAPASARNLVQVDSLTINDLDDVLINHPSSAVAKRDQAELPRAVRRYTAALRQVMPKSIVWLNAAGVTVSTLHPPLTAGYGALNLATGI
jgi:hypothetical protein